MLGWITGQNSEGADDSRVLEPPETPAPVFAIRAFKSALFGTPGADDEGDGEPTMARKTRAADHQRSRSDIPKLSADKPAAGLLKTSDNEMAAPPVGSPTKSILVTPGTTSNRRKTVSFGDAVLDNERRKDATVTKPGKLQFTPSGNVSSQWISGQPDGRDKVRSKLTQSLLDARENPSNDPPTLESSRPSRSSKEAEAAAVTKAEEDPADTTTNLDEPCSQSGQYWKAEFESYRMKTNREIKKLIQYRSVAKSYARKKDAEALRLADKLREEEAKVTDMERHVSNLASTMVGGGGDTDKEKLVQELTKQTALALQYKHKVNRLRKALERHGVIGSDVEQQDDDVTSEKKGGQLHKTQAALDEANTKIEELSREQPDLKKLQGLAQSSERKASELEKENTSLKLSLARVKQEMTKYEGRRKEKEAKLKQREAKLEARNQEYRERLKAAAQEHREAQESFSEERRRMQEQIDSLRSRIYTIERFTTAGSNIGYAYSPIKGQAGVEVYDFGLQQQNRYGNNHTREHEDPGSPSPHSKRHSRHPRTKTSEIPGQRNSASRVPVIQDEEEPLIWLEESPPRPIAHHSHRQGNYVDMVPPSSPPALPSMEKSLTVSPEKPRYDQQSRRPFASPRPTMIGFPSSPEKPGDQWKNHTHHVRRSHQRVNTRPSVLHNLAAEQPLLDNGRTTSLASVRRDAMSPERLAAAKARLRQKHGSKKGNDEMGKENVRTYVN